MQSYLLFFRDIQVISLLSCFLLTAPESVAALAAGADDIPITTPPKTQVK